MSRSVFSINTLLCPRFKLAGMKPNRLWLAPVLLGAVLISSPGPCANGGTLTGFYGTYNGLLHPEGELVPEQSGYFTIKASANGHFTGKLLVGSRRASFHGKFDDQGEATVNVWLTTVDFVYCGSCEQGSVAEKKRTLTWTLDLQLVKDGEQITGQVLHRRGERWIAVLSGDRAGFALTNPAPQAGQYTFILPGNSDLETTNSPNGHGSGTLTVDTSGKVVLKGVLADGTIISQSAVLSKDGIWPLFVPLYKKGMLLAWMTFTNLPETDLVGTVTWIRPASPGAQLWPAGFTNDIMVVASHYAQANPVLDLTNGIVVFRGGRLGSPLTNSVTLGAGSVIATTSGNSVTLTTAAKTGLFKGSVREPTAAQVISFRGAVLQKQNAGFGYFLDARRSGEVFLGSSPEDGR
jgi:hypothetical protein